MFKSQRNKGLDRTQNTRAEQDEKELNRSPGNGKTEWLRCHCREMGGFDLEVGSPCPRSVAFEVCDFHKAIPTLDSASSLEKWPHDAGLAALERDAGKV